MPFRVYNSVVNNTALVHLSDNNHSIRITIIPELAMLHEFNIPVNGQPFNIIENYPLEQPVKDQVTYYFRSAKLSPWVCRLADGRYEFQGRTYQVRRMYSDGTALHGLLFDQPFELISQSADEASAYVTLEHNYKGYDPGFPFHYRCQVTYTLESSGVLKIATHVTNTGTESMPIADGWHPYFKLGGRADDWELYFKSVSMVEFDHRLVPTGRLLPFERFDQPSRIGDIKLDNCFVLEMGAGHGDAQSLCTLRNPANNVSVSFVPERSYGYLQLFIPDHRQSIAIENLSSTPDSFNNQMGLKVLEPGKTASFQVYLKAEVE